jgi:hypothetical protein
MAEEFLSGSIGSVRPNSAPEMPEREPIRFLIIGTREGVKEEIKNFYAIGFAQVDEWSPLTGLKQKTRTNKAIMLVEKGYYVKGG